VPGGPNIDKTRSSATPVRVAADDVNIRRGVAGRKLSNIYVSSILIRGGFGLASWYRAYVWYILNQDAQVLRSTFAPENQSE
jgi:hypothetical protein